MIPKIIHCCWLSGEPKDSQTRACQASWTRFASDYEIREWDLPAVEAAARAAHIVLPPFVRTALARRKWAFAADWVRFFVLEREGGVYFDCDFELLAPIDDLRAQGEFVAGQWMPDGSVGLEPAVIALEKGSPRACAMRTCYETAAFDGRTTVGELLAAQAAAGLRVLPPEVFSPIDVRGVCHRTPETRGIHHYAMSWAPPARRFARWCAWHGLRGVVAALLRLRRPGRGRQA